MSVEDADYPEDFNADWPQDADLIAEGAGHIRLIKAVTKLMRGLNVNSVSAARTFALADANKTFYHPATDTTARTWTIPANSSVAFPTGTVIVIWNEPGAGDLTLAITTDTLYHAGTGNSGTRTIPDGAYAFLFKYKSTGWAVVGTGLT